MAKKPRPEGLKKLLCAFISYSQKGGLMKRNEVATKLWDKKKLFHEEAIDHVLEHGLVSSSWTFNGVVYSKLCRVEMRNGYTRDDLAEFFSQMRPCPIWDAFLTAEAKGMVRITGQDN